ncbi:MAG: DUF4493 domain-containing protein, partial [Rikenellaceae bacterium]|nr:DUF4493 domain-containing protein [Rikenellaceae bacterium]
MKKILLLLPLSILSFSCSDNGETGVQTGSIEFNLSGVPDPFQDGLSTPTWEFSTYTVNLSGPSNKTLSYPGSGKIEGLTPGSYTVTLSSHNGGIPNPSFNNQYYTGSVNTTVKAGEVTPVSLTMTQCNAGVCFVYDTSLQEAGINVVPTVASENGTLQFSGIQKEGKGYFHPGELTVTLSESGSALSIGDGLSQTFTLDERELCEITLYHGQLKNGGVSVHPSIQTVST